MPFRGWLCPRLASFLTSSGFPAVTLSDILNYLMQAKHEAFLRVTRKEIKIKLAQRETCFPLRKCCLCKHKHAPLSVSHAMQTLGRADLCGHTRWLVPTPQAPPSVAASALPHAGQVQASLLRHLPVNEALGGAEHGDLLVGHHQSREKAILVFEQVWSSVTLH